MNRNQDLITALIIKAQRLSGDFNELLQKTTCLLADSESVKQKFKDCYNVHEEQILSNLVKYCNDGNRVQQLLENTELKRTIDEYKQGIKLIMEKYKIHTKRSNVTNQINLCEEYVAKLQQVADGLDSRLREMTVIMLYSVGLDEIHSSENQRTIEQLTKDNAEMRRKLQIYSDSNDVNYFEQALPPRSDSSTQSEPSDTMDLDSISVSSTSSFATCFSYNQDAESPDNPIKADEKQVQEPEQPAE